MPRKLISCVKKVQKKNKGLKTPVNPWAICISSLNLRRVGKHQWRKR